MHTPFILRQRNYYPLLFLGLVVVANAAELSPIDNALPPSIPRTKQRNINTKLEMLENLLNASMRITNADGGVLYLLDPKQRVLRFVILRTNSLKIAMGGTTGVPINFYPINLYDKDGNPVHSMMVTHSALSGETVNIPDAYVAEGYDFSGPIKFDAKTGYRSKSFLTVPMINYEDKVIGVLQLINAQNRESGAIIPFSNDDQQLLESLASQAAIALSVFRAKR